jgi:hypothetical protein
MPLSDEARQMIQESIAIVREDRFEKYVRGRMAKDEQPPKDTPKGKDTPPPPPKSENEPPPEPKSLWWGDVFSGANK